MNRITATLLLASMGAMGGCVNVDVGGGSGSGTGDGSNAGGTHVQVGGRHGVNVNVPASESTKVSRTYTQPRTAIRDALREELKARGFVAKDLDLEGSKWEADGKTDSGNRLDMDLKEEGSGCKLEIKAYGPDREKLAADLLAGIDARLK